MLKRKIMPTFVNLKKLSKLSSQIYIVIALLLMYLGVLIIPVRSLLRPTITNASFWNVLGDDDEREDEEEDKEDEEQEARG